MPEDVGGTPLPGGGEPDDDRDHGGADDEFASVVFDEEFVRAARIHEPTAVERLLAAAQARAEAEARRGRARRSGADGREAADDDFDDHAYDGYGPDDGVFGPGRDADDFDDFDDLDEAELLEDGRGRYGRRGARVRWHRPVAWMLALLMGIGMVAFAFAAVYRGASSGRQDRIPPPATTEVEQTRGAGETGGPSASAEFGQPAVPAEPRTP
ncbi:hypothetical protein AB0I84_26720 [Streptomyces spectabilis]|uniref:SCO2584 family spore wall biosynthesis protein n=1 Tax=Streptomyces spectabilis TaxID=68270 RepID=UPI0033EE37B5